MVKVPGLEPASAAAASVALTVTVGTPPDNGTLTDELTAELAITRLAERTPRMLGMKFSGKVQLAPAANARLLKQVVPGPGTIVNSAALVPLQLTAFDAFSVSVSLSLSTFLKVSVCAPVWPTRILPKFTLVGLGTSIPSAVLTILTAAVASTMPAPQVVAVQSKPVPVGKARALLWEIGR